MVMNTNTLRNYIVQDYPEQHRRMLLNDMRTHPLIFDHMIETMFGKRLEKIRPGYYVFT